MNAHLVILALIVLAAAAAWRSVKYRRHLPRHRVLRLRLRLHLRRKPGPGFASLLDLHWHWGRFAMFRQSRRSRRSASAWRRATRPHEHSVRVARAHWRHSLAVTLEEHITILSLPRKRKSASLAAMILHYPGPVVSTSTRTDQFDWTAGIRQHRGHPVHVFNPEGIGGARVPSTFSWNLVSGCEDPATAIRRADAFAFAVSTEGASDAAFWSGKCSDYLRAMFHAAAIAGRDLRDVAAWSAPDSNGAEAQAILLDAGTDSATVWAGTLAEMGGEAQKTVETVRMVLSRSLALLTDPALVAAVVPPPGGGLDIDAFLRERGTLYMIAKQRKESPLAPLFATLAGEIHFAAEQMGSQMPGGRLDPPLLMALDEVTQICPVPLPDWLPDSGGKGIQIIAVAHGQAQLRMRWGNDGAQVIMDTSSCLVFMPGIRDPVTLKLASDLAGDAAYREHGQEHASRHPIMTEGMVRQIPLNFGLFIRGELSPVMGRMVNIRRDWTYRRARLARRTAARITEAPAAATGRRQASVTLPLQQQSAVAELPAVARLRPVTDAAPVLQPAANGHGNANGHSNGNRHASGNGNGHAGAGPFGPWSPR